MAYPGRLLGLYRRTLRALRARRPDGGETERPLMDILAAVLAFALTLYSGYVVLFPERFN